jgi:hypothetical protein
VEHDVQFRLHQEGDELTGVRRDDERCCADLRENPNGMIFPFTVLLYETENDASIACYFHVTEPRLPVKIACPGLRGSVCSPGLMNLIAWVCPPRARINVRYLD